MSSIEESSARGGGITQGGGDQPGFFITALTAIAIRSPGIPVTIADSTHDKKRLNHRRWAPGSTHPD